MGPLSAACRGASCHDPGLIIGQAQASRERALDSTLIGDIGRIVNPSVAIGTWRYRRCPGAPTPEQFHGAADRRSRGYPSRVAVIRTVSKFMTNEPP